MLISLIVAASENNVIGRDNQLPWDLPDDLRYFKEKTKEHAIIMGRKCFESIGRPLPHRRNIIITRQEGYQAEGCEVVSSLLEALELVKKDDEAFIIGGGQIYEQALPLAQRIYLTRVHATIEGDIFFPALESEWKEVSALHHEKDEKHEYAFTFVVLERKK